MSFHYPTVNYQIPLHFWLKRGEPPLKLNKRQKFGRIKQAFLAKNLC